MEIIEERLFNVRGQLMVRTATPPITSLRQYRNAIGSKLAGMSWHRYDGKRGVCFLLKDGRILIVILGHPVRAMASTITPTSSARISTGVAAD